MLDRRHRLRDSAGFTAATRRGRRAGSRTVVVHLLVDADPEPAGPPGGEGPRVGLVVSKAVGPAVVRNRVKRRLRHLLRARVATVPPAGILVVRALPAAADASSAVLGADLDAALRRVRRGAARPSP